MEIDMVKCGTESEVKHRGEIHQPGKVSGKGIHWGINPTIPLPQWVRECCDGFHICVLSSIILPESG